MKYIISGSKIRRVKGDIIFLDEMVSFFEYNGKFYILDKDFFNSFFKFREMYKKYINKNIEGIKKCDVIDNMELFIDNCKGNGHYIKKLTKAIILKCFENIEKNKDKIPNVIDEFNLKIELDENNRIIYKEKDTKEILDLLLEHYVKSALTNKKMIAKALDYSKKIN